MTQSPNISEARDFAILAHAGQRYSDEVPYATHLAMVVTVLARFGYTDPAMVCSAWLHDSIEDTNTSYNDIANKFGNEVAERVYAVTSELGRNRKERNAKTYPKLRTAMPQARALKLADRIANVEYGLANLGKNDMYAREHADFYAQVRVASDGPVIDRMWDYLAKLLRS